MSHEPPVPKAARSPYPLQQPPDPEAGKDASAPGHVRAREDGETATTSRSPDNDRSWGDRAREAFGQARESKVAIGAAVGIGSAALLAALLYSRRGGRRNGV
jgi:hypothetical protein